MARLTKITNTSSDNIKVKLTGGPEVTLPPQSTLENVDVDNVAALQGRVSVREDLTEVAPNGGKLRIDG